MPDLPLLVSALVACLDGEGFRFVLFGSRATGHNRPNSDWDIGVLGPRPLFPMERTRMRMVIEEWPTLHTIDLVDLTAASERFRTAALAESVPLEAQAA
ncbi:MAG TPA: nucleotidyltransferase domain-containing protein [Kiritimatiellia bacterium]|nr:nucleotidyltransferase domain-containing protein [Kiritimatiellia bacterium]